LKRRAKTLLNSKYDREIERLMGEEGLTHAEAMAKVAGSKKSKAKPPEGSAEEEDAETPEEESAEDDEGEGDSEDANTIDLPAALVPGAAVGKEVDISVTGIVKSKGNGTVCIELSRTSGSSREPYKPSTGNAPEVAR
jgi:hypothetical protein